ncbi:MAG: hypothetical protein KDA57_23185, partial [Planctomycetales bacterium]|nr:hypothetical protein [Planctomycetales bacterium]
DQAEGERVSDTWYLGHTRGRNSWARIHQRVTPNPSLKLTRYGRRCKPGPRQQYYCREPGLQHLSPRAA